MYALKCTVSVSKMHYPGLCVTLLLAVGATSSANIPSSIKGCQRDDPQLNECAINTANALFPSLVHGNKNLAIPNMDPFEIKSLVLNEKNGQELDFDLDLKDVRVHGLKDATIEKGSKLDLNKRTVQLKIAIPTIIFQAKYVVDGKVLVLPIKGNGRANLTLGGVKTVFDSQFTLNKHKDGKEYVKLVNSKVDATFERFNIQLTNLFDGDRTLGEQTNVFLNKNWRRILRQFAPIISKTIKSVVLTIVDDVAMKVPYDVLFPK